MIKLSDYLNYLNQEIIQARKKADEAAILVAKEYAKHEYLKYFKVPRYSMPNIKLDIPIKITDIDQEAKYNFKIDQSKFLIEVNEKINEVNTLKNMKIAPITSEQLKNENFQSIFKTLEKKDQKFGKEPLTELRKIDLTSKISNLNLNIFRPSDTATKEENDELKNIFSQSLLSNYRISGVKLNSIYIDPKTTTAEDKDKEKLFINLHVEMEEEGIRIIYLKDERGNDVEQIIFE